MAREILRVDNLSKTYKKRGGVVINAVNNISFSVSSGEIVGFLGPNGAGKSTTIKMITGLALPTSGDIYILGKNMAKEREETMNQVGGVIENPDMYNDWTAYENLIYLTSLHVNKEDNRLDFRALENPNAQDNIKQEQEASTEKSKSSSKKKMSVAINDALVRKLEGKDNAFSRYVNTKKSNREKVDDILKLVGLYDRRNDKVKTYSLGMKQRLGIAQAIINNPALLVLDEPANGLDPAGIKELRDMLRQCAHKLDMGVLVSSHLLSEMELMCDRYIIIDSGVIVQEKTIGEDVAETTEGKKVTVSIKVDKMEEAKSYLETLLGEEVIKVGATLQVTTDKETSFIIRELVKADYNVSSVEVVKESLEDAYLSVTKRIGDK
ncbi:MAG TPA: ABC transporter ATP-binding protein [Clostridia bacterium]|jgi:ABC-2 type transport system ATP-binding protein|nr:ABC transporter ATP-binding protein [Clostridia bacterium]